MVNKIENVTDNNNGFQIYFKTVVYTFCYLTFFCMQRYYFPSSNKAHIVRFATKNNVRFATKRTLFAL